MSSIAYLQKAYLAYFGRPVDATGIAAFGPTSTATDAQVNAAFFASAESQALYGTTFGVTQINAIYQMLFGRQAEPAGLAYWANEVARGALTPAGAAVGIMNGALNADATAVTNKLAASAAYQAAIDTTPEILAYVGDTAAGIARAFLATVTTTAPTAAAIDAAIITMVNGSVGVGSTFTLTTGSDNIVGTNGNDVIIGDFTATATLNVSDQINGGAGTDTLKMFGTYNAALVPVGITNVETVQFVSALAAGSLDVSTTFTKAANGVTSLVFDNVAALTGHTITASAGQTVSLATGSTNAATAGAVTVALGAADTTSALTLNGYQGATGVAVAALTATGAATTTMNLVSQGAANAVTTLTGPATATTLNIAATSALTVSTSLASAAATKVNITGGSAVAIAGSDFAATVAVDASATTGGVSYAAEAAGSVLTFTGGSGNDNVTFAAGTLTTADILAGGLGTDRITINDTTPVYAAINAATAFEVLALATTGATVNIASLTSINAFRVNAGNLTETFNNALSTSTFTIDNSAANSGTVTVSNKTGELTTGITVDMGAAVATQTLASLVMTGASTINLVSQGGTGTFANVITNTDTSDNSVINITGARALTITNALDGTTVGSTVNASAFTGVLTLTGSGFNDIITGGSANDVLVGGAGDDTIVGGAGNDRITSGAGADTLTGGAGVDTFALTTGAAADLFVGSVATAAEMDRITDFVAGTDKIALVNATTAVTSVVLTSVTVATAATVAALLTAIGNQVAASTAPASQVGVITVTAGAMAGTYLLVNDTANAAAATDTLINITGVSGTIATGDFVFA